MFLIKAAKRVSHRIEYMEQRRKEVQPRPDAQRIGGAAIADLRRQGFSLWDSFCWDLQWNDYRDYISTWEGWQPARSRSDYFKISADKHLFACVFGPQITVPRTLALIEKGRLVDLDAQGGELYDRLWERGGAVIKDRFGCSGYNVTVLRAEPDGLYDRDELLTREGLSNIIRNFAPRGGGVIQERLCQGRFENQIFDGSVNTVRVLSMRKRDDVEHEVIGAMHRFGTRASAPLDNFHQGGACARIDIETGRMGKLASMYDTDESGRHIFRAQHPDTGAQVEGIAVPGWEQLKARVAELTRRLPFLDCIAWDFVVQDDGFALIEINKKTALDIFQIHGGMRRSLIGEKYRERGYLVERWG